MILAVAFLTCITAGFYWYYKRTYSYWSSRGIDGPTPIPLLGNSGAFFYRKHHEVQVEYRETYGDIYG